MPSQCVTANLNWFTILCEEEINPKMWKVIFSQNSSLICAITEICYNVVGNNVVLSDAEKQMLKPYKRKMHKLSRKTVGKKQKLQIILKNKDLVKHLCKVVLPQI